MAPLLVFMFIRDAIREIFLRSLGQEPNENLREALAERERQKEKTVQQKATPSNEINYLI